MNLPIRTALYMAILALLLPGCFFSIDSSHHSAPEQVLDLGNGSVALVGGAGVSFLDGAEIPEREPVKIGEPVSFAAPKPNGGYWLAGKVLTEWAKNNPLALHFEKQEAVLVEADGQFGVIRKIGSSESEYQEYPLGIHVTSNNVAVALLGRHWVGVRQQDTQYNFFYSTRSCLLQRVKTINGDAMSSFVETADGEPTTAKIVPRDDGGAWIAGLRYPNGGYAPFDPAEEIYFQSVDTNGNLGSSQVFPASEPLFGPFASAISPNGEIVMVTARKDRDMGYPAVLVYFDPSVSTVEEVELDSDMGIPAMALSSSNELVALLKGGIPYGTAVASIDRDGSLLWQEEFDVATAGTGVFTGTYPGGYVGALNLNLLHEYKPGVWLLGGSIGWSFTDYTEFPIRYDSGSTMSYAIIDTRGGPRNVITLANHPAHARVVKTRVLEQLVEEARFRRPFDLDSEEKALMLGLSKFVSTSE